RRQLLLEVLPLLVRRRQRPRQPAHLGGGLPCLLTAPLLLGLQLLLRLLDALLFLRQSRRQPRGLGVALLERLQLRLKRLLLALQVILGCSALLVPGAALRQPGQVAQRGAEHAHAQDDEPPRGGDPADGAGLAGRGVQGVVVRHGSLSCAVVQPTTRPPVSSAVSSRAGSSRAAPTR